MFPINPNISDSHTEQGKVFVYNGEGWVLQSDLILPDGSRWDDGDVGQIIPKSSKHIPSTIIDGLPLFGDIVTHNVDEFATALTEDENYVNDLEKSNLHSPGSDNQVASDFDIKDLTDSTFLRDTWSGKQDAIGFTPENVSNKSTTLTNSDTDYPTTKAVNTGLSTKSDTTHNHTLASLTERSYNSLTDKPNLDAYIDIIDVQFWRDTEDGFPEGLDGDLLYNLEDLKLYVYILDIGWILLPFDWKFYLDRDITSDFYGKYFVYNGIELSIIPDGLVLGETSLTAFDGLRGKAAYDHSLVTGNPHGTTAANVGAEPTIVPTADTTPVDTDDVITKRGATWLKTTYANWKINLALTFAKISDYFNKTESDRRFVNQNGGTIYNITRWFTPTSALTIAANGLSATITSGQFTAAMTGAKLRLTGGVNEPIITFVNSNNITLSFAVDASFFGQSVAVADWGVYNKAIVISTNGDILLYYTSGGTAVTTFAAGSGALSNTQQIQVSNQIALSTTLVRMYKDMALQWSDSSIYTSTKDTGLFRPLAGLLQIYDGITTTALRDLKLRSLFADMFKANLSTGFTFKNSSDVDVFAIDNNGFQLDQYDDVLPSTEWTPASGGAAPDIATHTIGTIAANYRAFDGVNTEESMTSSFEILHGIDVDALNRVTTPLLAEVHTHGMAATTGSGVVKIFYDIVYQGVNMAPKFLGTFTNLITVNANEQYWHKLGGVEFTKPTGGFAIGGQLIVKYRRNPQDAQDTYTGDWLFMQCALHMPFNSNGSRQRYVK